MKLLMIADDFTGALDAGVQFAKKGFKTGVLVYPKEGFGEIQEVDVLVVDAETRHRTPQEAYTIVYSIVKPAMDGGIPYVFKKTDSALRGNIGAELTAVLDAAGEGVLAFIPALPRMNRITLDGIHYVDGIPVEESVFGADPFEPVTVSDVEKLIHQQCSTKVEILHKGEILTEVREKTIGVYDCTSDEEMEEIAGKLKEKGAARLVAGCAGLAETLPQILGWEELEQSVPKLPEQFLVVCGSVNPITVKQLDYAQEHGFVRIQLTPEQKLREKYFDTEVGREWLDWLWEICSGNQKVIIDSNDFMGNQATEEYAREHGISWEQVRIRIPDALGRIVGNMVKRGLNSSMLMTGGDTLLGCIQLLDDAQLTPVGEFEMGIVLSELVSKQSKTHVFTKSGGFGEETLLTDMAKKICREG